MSFPDPFGAASVRERVLAAWAASPERFREDANAEEDLRLGGYRDRVVVELAQNAADAATAAGVPGRLLLSLMASPDATGWVLSAANTGAPLTAAGVTGLATLRASAKRDDADRSAGRFGVGFAAVLALSDEPMVVSRSGSVRFSREDTAELVGQLDSPGLLDELRRRDGRVPVLRLPFEAEGEPPQGFSTAVLLPLRDSTAVDAARRLLADVDDALLLALPALAEIEIDVEGQHRVLSDVRRRWTTRSREGLWSAADQAELLADRPVEEVQRPWWSVTWALPLGDRSAVPSVVHAPTPTDEPLDWPALLIATFPLDPTRRHIASGGLTDRLVAEAASTYADLLTDRAAGGVEVLDLVPTGLGAGPLDSALRRAALDRLQEAPILHAVEDGAAVRPRDAVQIDGALGDDPAVLHAVARHLSGLVAAPTSGRNALRSLAVRAMRISDIVEALPDATDPDGWRARYAALAPLAADPEGVEALAILPVPLADGRLVRGPRGLLLPGPGLSGDVLADLAEAGIRLVHPAAEHPLLARLGAVPASAREILDDPAVRELVENSPEADDPDAIAETVLGLVAAAVEAGELAPGDLIWLGDLALPDADDELAPASALALPGSAAAELLDPEEIGLVAAALVDRWDAATLTAAGVLATLGVTRADEVDLADLDESLADLDGIDAWAQEVLAAGDGAIAGELSVVRDLDAVRADAWPRALAVLAGDPVSRSALVDPVRVRDRRGQGRDVPSYTSWWLRRQLGLDGRLDPGGDPGLRELFDPAPGWVAELDDGVRRALGVVRDIEDLGATAVPLVMDRLADPHRELTLRSALAIWTWLAERDGSDTKPPAQVRAWSGTQLAVVDADDACVVDSPIWLQRSDIGAFVIAPRGRGGALADRFDLDLAPERADGIVTSVGRTVPMPSGVARLVGEAPTQWCQHDDLEVDGVRVRWWVDAAGVLHAVDDKGLADAVAWSLDRWPSRHDLRRIFTDPAVVAEVLAEASFD